MTDHPAIEVSTFIEAPVDVVFSFFADPARFALWFEHGSQIRPGRGGEVVLKSPMGPPASGPILEWIPNRKVVFAFGHPEGSGMLPPGSTTVTVLFAEVAGGTKVTVLHEGLPTERDRAGAGGGWRAALGRLSSAAWSQLTAGHLERLADDWVAAWNETDGARRAEHVARCFAEDGEFCDQFTRLQGRHELHGWIGGVLAMMPGAALERAGPVQQLHAYSCWPWQVRKEGAVIARGVNYCDLTPELRWRRVVGFWTQTPAH